MTTSKGGMGHQLFFSMDFRGKFLMEKVGKPWQSCPGIPVPGRIKTWECGFVVRERLDASSLYSADIP